MSTEGKVEKMRDLQALIDRTLQNSTTFTKTILGRPLSATMAVELINSLKSGILATTKSDGSSHLAAMLFAYADGKLYTCAHPKSLCYKNMARDDRVGAAFTERGGKGRTIILEGRVKMLGPVNRLVDSVLANIEKAVGPWYARTSATHSSLENDESRMFEIHVQKIFTYSG